MSDRLKWRPTLRPGLEARAPSFALVAWWAWCFAAIAQAASPGYFGVRIIDDETERGVPLVELRSVHNVSYWTDSAGWAAIDEPNWHGQNVFFHIASPGYEYPADGFGYRGIKLPIEPGGTHVVRIHRKYAAERLYRITGEGVYRDSALLCHDLPWNAPPLNAQVVGSDSTVCATYRGRLYWFWGDTFPLRYPLGNFAVPGATSSLPAKGGLTPSVGIDLKYFVDASGFAKETCPLPGAGPTWIDGLTVIQDEARERMFASYVKIKPPMEVYERGLVEFNDSTQEFEKRQTFSEGIAAYPMGHPFTFREGDVDYIYYPKPLPLLRVPADAAALADANQYESYTYAVRDGDDWHIERDEHDALQWRWRRGEAPLTPQLEEQWAKSHRIGPNERVFVLRDLALDKDVHLHSASIAWNTFRKRWTMIVVEVGGTESFLGEIWYAEAERPEGPWLNLCKAATHDRYSFYNPLQHPALAEEDGRIIYFEGTYTKAFSGNERATPRYDYNQVLYRLDLANLKLPLPP